MTRAEERVLEEYPIHPSLPDKVKYYIVAEQNAYKKGYEQAIKDFMEKAVEWLNSCLDNGCWVANDLCDHDKKAIVQSFKEMMSE